MLRNMPVLSCFAGLAWPMRGPAWGLALFFLLLLLRRTRVAPSPRGPCGPPTPQPSKRLESPGGKLHNGPFETDREARAAAHQVVRPEPGWSILHKSQNRFVLEQACEAAGSNGVYDRQILDWLSGFEDSVCGVVAGLVARAVAAAGPDPQPGAGAVPVAEPLVVRASRA